MAEKENVFSFIWKIKNFSMIPRILDEELKSPAFMVDTWKKVDFRLWLFPGGLYDEGNIALFLCIEPQHMELKMNFSLTLLSTEPSRELKLLIKNHLLTENWGFLNLVSISEVLTNKQIYLPQDTLTIRCDINPIEETSAEEFTVNKESKSVDQFFKKSCVSRTSIEVHQRSMSWSIQNIKERIERGEEASITLASALTNAPSLKLKLIFNKTSDCIQILIQQTCISSERERLFVKCKITVLSAPEQYPTFEESFHLFRRDISDVWSFPPFLTTRMLADEKYLYLEDTLILRCQFSFSFRDRIQHMEDNYMPFFETGGNNNFESGQLSSSIGNICANGKFCDIQLKAGGQTFPYYKVVLCERSPVFKAMFENDMREKSSGVVEIDDVDPDTLQRMLTYMHSFVLEEDLSPEDVRKLYEVADKYDVASLKRRCSVFFLSTLSVESVCALLVLADAHQDGLLMTAACEFVSSRADEVFHSAQWKIFMEDHSKLSSCVMHQMLIGKY